MTELTLSDRLEIRINDGQIKPGFLVSGAGQLGVLVPGSPDHPNNVAGVSLMGGGTNGRFNFNVVNDGERTDQDGGQALVCIHGRGQSDIGIEIFQAGGTTWKPESTKQGNLLGKFSAFGHTGLGYAENDSVAIWAWAEEEFTSQGQPNAANTSAPANLLFGTTDKGSNYPQARGGFNHTGAFVLGYMMPHSNDIQAGPGVMVMREAAEPSTPPTGQAYLYFRNGALKLWKGGEPSPIVLA